MKIIISNNNKVEFSSIDLKNGNNFLGQVDGVINPETLELNPVEKSENLREGITPAEIYARAGIISMQQQDQFGWASPDFSAFSDIFYANLPENKILLTDNLFEAISYFKELTIKKQNIDYFIRLGYFPPGKTFFEEIKRIKIGNKLEIENGKPVEKSIWNFSKAKINYETFKTALSSVISCLKPEDTDAVFMSSGCDSGLVTALIAGKFKKSPLALTFHRLQALKVNAIDVNLAKDIADFWGIRHELVQSDYDNQNTSYLDLFFKKMPLGAHLLEPYYLMAQRAKEKNIKKIWAGENSDYLYNLGPTTKTTSGKIRRFYFSKQYINSLPDIKGNSPFGFFYKFLGELGRQAWKMNLNPDVRQPKNFKELVFAWQNSPAFLALPPKNDNNYKKEPFSPFLTSLEARSHMLETMVQFMLPGRDGRAIQEPVKECSMKPVLPYSATNMIHFYRGMETSIADALKPKRFNYQYLKELVGDDDYERLYVVPRTNFLEKSKHHLNLADYQKGIINKTNFGLDLKTAVLNMISQNSVLKNFKYLYDFDSLYFLVDAYWLGQMLKTLKEAEIELKYSE